ncbi:MAG: hypothetical protein ACREAK_07000, partial [Nitrosarchaeum sp.]
TVVFANIAYKANDSTINPNCMNMETVGQFAQFQFKIPTLPPGYALECGSANTYEIHLLYSDKPSVNISDDHKSLQDNLEGKISQGGIYLFIFDEKDFLGQQRFESDIGDTNKLIVERYDAAIKENPNLNLQLIQINGRTAWANESCTNCGQQSIDFSDGKVIENKFEVPTRIYWYDENGVVYYLKANMPLDTLKQVAESLK